MTKIGVFDSGVGGLWILKNLQDELPGYDYIFFGDQGHVPYGSRSIEEIRSFSEAITNFLINKGCNIIVIACNTASAASLKYLRDKFPKILFVGMEPAIKPAVEITNTKKVGVLATPATFQGELYNSVVERFAHDVEIFKDTCPGLVKKIEDGDLDSSETHLILEKALLPMIEKGVDTIVLGCTHYPFAISKMKEILGEKINVIDPTEAVVRQVSRVLEENNLANEKLLDNSGCVDIYTSSDPARMNYVLLKLFKSCFDIKRVEWGEDLKLTILDNE
jgi:glutamate racemase